MAQVPPRSAYESMLGTLEGSDFQDEVCARLQSLIVDFQRIPAKPSGDGGLDGLSHNQRCAYCCYGPEQTPFKVNAKGLKDDIVAKFSSDLRRLHELSASNGTRLRHSPNEQLATIIANGNKIANIYLVVSWFESHRVIGPLNTAFARYKSASQLRFVDASATLTIWGPKDLATRGEVDEHTLFRIENRALFERVRLGETNAIPAESAGDFDAKFDDLKRRRPDRAAHIDALAQDFRRAWAAAIALDNHLASTSVGLHEALENARQEAAIAARLRSMGKNVPHELIESMQREVASRLGQHFGERLGSLTTKIATGVVAGLIGECPLEWRGDGV